VCRAPRGDAAISNALATELLLSCTLGEQALLPACHPLCWSRHITGIVSPIGADTAHGGSPCIQQKNQVPVSGKSSSTANGGVYPAGSWSPGDGAAWSQTAPWNDASLGPRRLGIIAGVGLGLLALVAFAGAISRNIGRSELGCKSGADCNRAALSVAQGMGGQAPDAARAARLYQRGCNLGDGAACNNLGLAFQSGRGVPLDEVQAFSFFELGCSRGAAEGCNNQGAMYEHGSSVPANLGDALRLYTQACRHGSALGCSNLGVLYAEGRGVATDRAEALRLFEESCNAGSSVGCNNLAQSHAADSSAGATATTLPVSVKPAY